MTMPDKTQKTPLTTLARSPVSVAPSILAADFARLGEEIRRAEEAGADVVHADVMDGHFVPNLSIGPPVVTSIRPVTSLPFDVHLMLDQPERYVDAFAEAGADNITVHVEIEADVREVLRSIHEAGCSAGLCVKPATPARDLQPFLDSIDLILVMTVEPGFGGQSFREDVVPKIRDIRAMLDEVDHPVHLEVDGGINTETAGIAVSAGANLLVAGTSVFRAGRGMADAIATLRRARDDRS